MLISQIPVLIVTYNRVEDFNSILLSTYKMGVRKYYIAIDGTNKEVNSKFEQYEEVLELFKLNDNVDVRVWYRKKNLGLAISMITAIDWLFSKEDLGIILEDDLVLSKSVIQYMITCLEIFKSSDDIFLISGNQFFDEPHVVPGITYSSYPLIWGWATWKNRWADFRKNLINGSIIKDNTNIPFNVRYFWILGYYKAISCRINSWAIILANYTLFNQLKCISPTINLISNIGLDESATNTIGHSWALNRKIFDSKIENLNFPNSSNLNIKLEKYIYRIKPKHVFLLFKILLLKLSKSEQNLLNTRIVSVKLPN